MTTLNSPLEDFERSTLQAIPGSLQKLEYVSSLRTPTGSYVHWGLSRVYGELAASKALQHAHFALISRILSTPLQMLMQDVERASQTAGVAPAMYVQELSSRTADLLPKDPGAGAALHFNSVLRALAGLVKSQMSTATRLSS